ncbi:MAG: type II secretion system F family protein [Pseudomonadota bacterium]
MYSIIFKFLFLFCCTVAAYAALNFVTSRSSRLKLFYQKKRETITSLINRLWRTRRTSRADAKLPDALALMRSALKAGLSMPQAIDMAGKELGGVLGEEMSRASSQIKLGNTVDEALSSLEARVPSEDIALFVRSIEVLRRTGGNLVESFDTLIETIDERKRVADKVRSLTAQGVTQAITLLALPWFMALALHLLAPDFIEPLFSTSTGKKLLLFALFLELLGALWLKKIVRIRV